MTRPSVDEQLRELTRGVVDFVSEKDLRDRLTAAEAAGRPLRVKVGFDPTRPDLHLGHTVVMSKMRQFQDFGHEVVFIVGDFTAAIGDPSGKNKTRPPLSRAEIEAGAKSYAEQAFKILDPSKTRVEHNSSWLDPMGFAEVIKLAGKYTLARMMERQDFKTRYEEGSSISLHELLYPLAQGYDSVHLRCDVEMGGTDQLFNLMVGRDLMKEWGLPPQIVMTMPILEGINARFEDGKIVGDKMSKSLDNYVGVSEPPEEQVGKLMSLSDPLMWRYYELLSCKDAGELAALKAACARGEASPKDAKMALAVELAARFHGEDAALRAKAAWEKQFSRREVPDDMPAFSAPAGTTLIGGLVLAQLASSNSDARRKVEQGAVDVDGERVKDVRAVLGEGARILRAGRHYARLVVG
jgi:tyrosyl-tRNA synthetase